MPKGKCRFTPELERKYPSFKKGRYEYEAECKVCLPGTFVSVLHKSSCDLEAHLETLKHKEALKGGSSSMKLTEFFVRTSDAVTAAEGAYAFHTVKHHNSFFIYELLIYIG